MRKEFLCNYDDLDSKDYIVVSKDKLKDEYIVFLNSDKKIKIFSSICPHFGGEIILDKKNQILSCKWHAYEYCPDVGRCLTYPKNLPSLMEYDALIEGQKIFLVLDD